MKKRFFPFLSPSPSWGEGWGEGLHHHGNSNAKNWIGLGCFGLCVLILGFSFSLGQTQGSAPTLAQGPAPTSSTASDAPKKTTPSESIDLPPADAKKKTALEQAQEALKEILEQLKHEQTVETPTSPTPSPGEKQKLERTLLQKLRGQPFQSSTSNTTPSLTPILPMENGKIEPILVPPLDSGASRNDTEGLDSRLRGNDTKRSGNGENKPFPSGSSPSLPRPNSDQQSAAPTLPFSSLNSLSSSKQLSQAERDRRVWMQMVLSKEGLGKLAHKIETGIVDLIQSYYTQSSEWCSKGEYIDPTQPIPDKDRSATVKCLEPIKQKSDEERILTMPRYKADTDPLSGLVMVSVEDKILNYLLDPYSCGKFSGVLAQLGEYEIMQMDKGGWKFSVACSDLKSSLFTLITALETILYAYTPSNPIQKIDVPSILTEFPGSTPEDRIDFLVRDTKEKMGKAMAALSSLSTSLPSHGNCSLPKFLGSVLDRKTLDTLLVQHPECPPEDFVHKENRTNQMVSIDPAQVTQYLGNWDTLLNSLLPFSFLKNGMGGLGIYQQLSYYSSFVTLASSSDFSIFQQSPKVLSKIIQLSCASAPSPLGYSPTLFGFYNQDDPDLKKLIDMASDIENSFRASQMSKDRLNLLIQNILSFYSLQRGYYGKVYNAYNQLLQKMKEGTIFSSSSQGDGCAKADQCSCVALYGKLLRQKLIFLDGGDEGKVKTLEEAIFSDESTRKNYLHWEAQQRLAINFESLDPFLLLFKYFAGVPSNCPSLACQVNMETQGNTMITPSLSGNACLSAPSSPGFVSITWNDCVPSANFYPYLYLQYLIAEAACGRVYNPITQNIVENVQDFPTLLMFLFPQLPLATASGQIAQYSPCTGSARNKDITCITDPKSPCSDPQGNPSECLCDPASLSQMSFIGQSSVNSPSGGIPGYQYNYVNTQVFENPALNNGNSARICYNSVFCSDLNLHRSYCLKAVVPQTKISSHDDPVNCRPPPDNCLPDGSLPGRPVESLCTTSLSLPENVFYTRSLNNLAQLLLDVLENIYTKINTDQTMLEKLFAEPSDDLKNKDVFGWAKDPEMGKHASQFSDLIKSIENGKDLSFQKVKAEVLRRLKAMFQDSFFEKVVKNNCPVQSYPMQSHDMEYLFGVPSDRRKAECQKYQ